MLHALTPTPASGPMIRLAWVAAALALAGGAQAQQRGLVDALGGLGEAVADAAARAKLGKPDRWQTVYVEERTVPLSQMLSELMQSRAGLGLLRGTGLGELLLASRAHEQAPLRFVQQALDKRGPARVKALAYCFCEPM